MIGAVNHDGFNVLPYRSRKRRELRRRRLIVLAAAGLAGCAAVGAVGGWDAFERSRLDARRAELDASLRTSGAQTEEHARLTRAEAERRRVRQTAQPLAAPRDRFLALLETLAQTPAQRGVSLQRVSQRTDEVELTAFAPDSQSAARWIKGLERVRDVKSVEIVEMKRHVDRYEFSALVRYTSQRQKGDAK